MNEHAEFHTIIEPLDSKIENNTPNNAIKEVLKKSLYLYYIKEDNVVRAIYSTFFITNKNNQFFIKKPFIRGEIKEKLLDRGELVAPYRVDCDEKEIIVNNPESLFIEFLEYEDWVDLDLNKASKQFKEKKIEMLLEINSTF